MPIFEYRCSACQHLEEVLQKHSDPGPAVCPECGKKGTLAKEMSATSFQLKGGGWYKDLYSSTSKDSKDSVSSPAPSSASTKAETKAETKTEAKTEKAPKAEKAPKKDTPSGSSSGGASGGSSSGGTSSGGTKASSAA